LVTADNARRIAEKVPGMDPDKAYLMGLLHDIGRREGVTGMLHVIDGYDYMMQLGEPEIAVICLTHSFASQNVEHFEGKHDCAAEQKTFIRDFVENRVYDDYDKLIQLCDAISLPEGACIMEKRFVDVALRHGVREYTTTRWRAYMDLKKYFDSLCGCDIYTLLPKLI
jgi:HD superfamily phosphodiesterase